MIRVEHLGLLLIGVRQLSVYVQHGLLALQEVRQRGLESAKPVRGRCLPGELVLTHGHALKLDPDDLAGRVHKGEVATAFVVV